MLVVIPLTPAWLSLVARPILAGSCATRICARTYTRTYTHAHACTCTCTCTRTRIQARTRTHARMPALTHLYTHHTRAAQPAAESSTPSRFDRGLAQARHRVEHSSPVRSRTRASPTQSLALLPGSAGQNFETAKLSRWPAHRAHRGGLPPAAHRSREVKIQPGRRGGRLCPVHSLSLHAAPGRGCAGTSCAAIRRVMLQGTSCADRRPWPVWTAPEKRGRRV